MSVDRIFDIISKLKDMDTDKFELVSQVVDSCLIVQALENGTILKVGDNICKR